MKGKDIRVYLLSAALIFTVLVLAIWLYWPGLNGPFLLDDPVNISVHYINDFSWDGIYYAATHNTSGALGRPVSVLSLLFSGIVHGPETWGYKYHNLMLHLLNGLLIFWLLLKLLPHLCTKLNRERITLIAGLTAACWLLHPLMVSTVLYAVQRMAQLSAFFTLAALLTFVFAREQATSRSWLNFYVTAYVLFPLFLLLAVFSKENGALIPVYILMMECLVFRFKAEGKREKTRVITLQVIFAALPIILGSLYLLTHLDRFFNFSHRDFTMWERGITQLQVMVFYLKLVLLPSISDMSLFHDGWPPVKQLDILTTLCFLLWSGVLALIFFCREKAPIVAFGLAWFLVSHLLESTIFNLELVFEHRNYLAAVGLLLIPVFYLVSNVGKRSVAFGALLVLPLISFMTYARVSEWQNADMIYTLAVRDHPESTRAQTAYASIEYRRGNLEKAIEHAAIAAELDETEYGSIILQILFLCDRNREGEINGLFAEATMRAGLDASTPYSFSALDKLAQEMQSGHCPEIENDQVLELIRAARQQKINLASRRTTGNLQRLEGLFLYFRGDFAKGYENMVLSFGNTKLVSTLVELFNIELGLGSLESAEHIVTIIEEENEARNGAEQVMLDIVKGTLMQAKEEAVAEEHEAGEPTIYSE